MNFLALFVIIPFLTALAVIATPAKNTALIKRFSLLGALITLISSLVLTWDYLKEIGRIGSSDEVFLLHQYSTPWFPAFNINYSVGVDGISVAMILLTAVVIFCGVLASWTVENRAKEFFALLLILVTGVFGVFISVDLFLFFLFYEIAVLPMYLLIGIWGTGKREYASMKLTLMLMAGSALIFVGILGLRYTSGDYLAAGSFSIVELANVPFPLAFQQWVFPCLFVGFGIIGALFPLHTWSPDGHASAPTAVSMLHAGVLMKLGGYGCLRTMYMLPEGARYWALFFMVLTTINIFYGALIATQKKDLKYITAYSSVSHCGFVLFGLCTLNIIGIQGGMIQMISHGIMTALFFALIGMIYGRTKTRTTENMSGLMQVMPTLGICYFIGGLAALGLPGLSGFVAEITVFVGAWAIDTTISRVLTIIACASIVVAAVYILRALTKIFYGPVTNPEFSKLSDATTVEKCCLYTLCAGLLVIGLYPSWLIRMIEFSLTPVMANLTRVL